MPDSISGAAALTALDPRKFQDPVWTADGSRRATVGLDRLDTLWFNTGTLCNIACGNCYIESSPTNDRLAYLTLSDFREKLDEIRDDGLTVRESPVAGTQSRYARAIRGRSYGMAVF